MPIESIVMAWAATYGCIPIALVHNLKQLH